MVNYLTHLHSNSIAREQHDYHRLVDERNLGLEKWPQISELPNGEAKTPISRNMSILGNMPLTSLKMKRERVQVVSKVG